MSDSAKKWRAFRSARKFARHLGLRSENAWVRYCRGEMKDKARKPDDIPRNPWIIYRKRGWKGMGDWLGAMMPRRKHWRIFVHARTYARGLGLITANEWHAFSKDPGHPDDIPATPDRLYRDTGWRGFTDWLGTGRIDNHHKRFRPFLRARAFVRTLKLRSQNEWSAYRSGKLPGKGTCPSDIPSNPYTIYRDKGWRSFGDWLGTGTVAFCYRYFRPFRLARTFVRSLGLRSGAEWGMYFKGLLPGKPPCPDDLPRHPSRVYRQSGWRGMGDWLGSGAVANYLKQFRPFDDARAFARSLKFSSANEWRAFCTGRLRVKGTRPSDIPSCPYMTYCGKGWKDWRDWLGTGAVPTSRRRYRPFIEARELVRALNFANGGEWEVYCKGMMLGKGMLPADVPACPRRVYRSSGWKSMGDWLGTGTIANQSRTFRPFLEARTFVHALKLRSLSEWSAYSAGRLPDKGTRPSDIPSAPRQVYRSTGWRSMGDWLGTGTVASFEKQFRPFRQARAFVRSLNLRSTVEWRAYCNGVIPGKGKRPDDIPSNPCKIYRGRGWKGMGDWLGTGNVASSLASFLPYLRARAFVRALDLTSKKEWMLFCKGMIPDKGTCPTNIPRAPRMTYRGKGWCGFGDWLGTRNASRRANT